MVSNERRKWRRIQREIERRVGPLPPELKRYEKIYWNAFSGFQSVVDLGTVFNAAWDSDIVLCGDYHTYRPTQEFCKELLMSLQQRGPVVLAMECFLSCDQFYLDEFSGYQLNFRELQDYVDWNRSCGFPDHGYRALAKYAREHGVQIIGLNGPGRDEHTTLAERDRHAGEVIADLRSRYPEAKILVLVGDLHVTHLPRWIQEARGDVKILQIAQNAEKLYWQLNGKGRTTEAVRVSTDAFCVFTGTPVEKLQSYLDWLNYKDVPFA